jgi:hypothetical protein
MVPSYVRSPKECASFWDRGESPVRESLVDGSFSRAGSGGVWVTGVRS